MSVSVALCTYNGAKYIEDQIRSILDQTLPVDEIVVCDDGSTDETLQIVDDIAKDTSIVVRIYRNENNIGVCANFQKAVDLCQGDIVFLSDQDDVWYPHKVKTIVEWFDRHPEKAVVFTNADLIDGQSVKNEADTLWDYFFIPVDRKTFAKGLELECMTNNTHATGATMAVRGSFLKTHPFLSYTTESALHDLVIAINATEERCIGYVDECLIQYRIHEKQQVGIQMEELCKETDWRRTFYPQIFIAELLKNPKSKERLHFQAWRRWVKHRAYGPVSVCLANGKYRNFYGKASLPVMLYDMKESIGCTKDRLLNRFLSFFQKRKTQ